MEQQNSINLTPPLPLYQTPATRSPEQSWRVNPLLLGTGSEIDNSGPSTQRLGKNDDDKIKNILSFYGDSTPAEDASLPQIIDPGQEDVLQLRNSQGHPHDQISGQLPFLVQQAYQQQTAQVSQMMRGMMTQFQKITQYMDTVERKLTSVEKMTKEILESRTIDQEALQIQQTEIESIKKMKAQMEIDAQIAKKLQNEFDLEQQKGKSKLPIGNPSKGITATPTPTPTPTPPPLSTPGRVGKIEMMELCPVCLTKVAVSELESHVNMCLDGGNVPQKEEPKKEDSLWKNIFGKQTPTPTPTPTPVAAKDTSSSKSNSASSKPKADSDSNMYPHLPSDGQYVYRQNTTPTYPFPYGQPYGNTPAMVAQPAMFYYPPTPPQPPQYNSEKAQ